MRTAVVHDWLTGMRGGERVLEAILSLVPEPTVFTLFHIPGSVSPAIESYPIRVSWLNRIPFSRRHYRNLLPLFPRAVEAFDLSGFDFVVSSSHCVAKGAIAPSGTPHLCYCHTPVRYAYDQFDAYFPEGRTRFYAFKRAQIERLRRWDVETSGRPARYLANSSAVAERIRRHYARDAAVCPPPVDTEFFHPSRAPREGFLLAVGALVPYKRHEDAIGAARSVGRPLVIVGRGPEERRLRTLDSPSVTFVAETTAEGLRDLYRRCAVFVQPGEEDFGISSVEALACGAPVVALARGGVRDVVRAEPEGLLYERQGAEGLAEALERAGSMGFDYTAARGSAERFSKERFRLGFRKAFEEMRE